mgnify:CR=1
MYLVQRIIDTLTKDLIFIVLGGSIYEHKKIQKKKKKISKIYTRNTFIFNRILAGTKNHKHRIRYCIYRI